MLMIGSEGAVCVMITVEKKDVERIGKRRKGEKSRVEERRVV
jgi:hypothetical protein